MIDIKLYGGLGNQLFQYALGRSISNKTGYPLKLDSRSGFKDDFFKRSFNLSKFNISCEITNSNILNNRFALKKNIFGKIYRRISSSLPLSLRRYYKEKKQFVFSTNIFNIKDGTYIDGYWQNLNYFEDIRDILVNEIKIKGDTGDIFKKINKHITQSNSVAIHLRFPHAFSEGKLHKKADKKYSKVKTEYYIKAINYFIQNEQNICFFVFSDNLEWAKKVMKSVKSNQNYIIVDTGSDIEDFELMKNCKHFIISNSTFSWWASYLSNYVNKKVMYPSLWFNQEFAQPINLFPDSWTSIDTRNNEVLVHNK